MSEIEKMSLPEDQCCKECKPQSEFKPNQCKKNDCCDLKEFKCPTDITNAKCIPILTERIYDCICIHHEETRYVDTPLEFTVDTPPSGVSYKDGDVVCIDSVATNYDFIGLEDNTLDIILNYQKINDVLTQNSVYSCGNNPLFNSYEGNIAVNYGCCALQNKGNKVSIIETALNFFVCNLEYVVKGRIGCEEFVGRFKLLGKQPLTPNPISFSGSMCLPAESKTVKIEEVFDSCLSASCISATTNYNNTTKKFNASVIISFICDKNIIATVKEKLVVYTSGEGKICEKGNYTSNCESDCK